jgi:hypothetical protein
MLEDGKRKGFTEDCRAYHTCGAVQVAFFPKHFFPSTKIHGITSRYNCLHQRSIGYIRSRRVRGVQRTNSLADSLREDGPPVVLRMYRRTHGGLCSRTDTDM